MWSILYTTSLLCSLAAALPLETTFHTALAHRDTTYGRITTARDSTRKAPQNHKFKRYPLPAPAHPPLNTDILHNSTATNPLKDERIVLRIQPGDTIIPGPAYDEVIAKALIYISHKDPNEELPHSCSFTAREGAVMTVRQKSLGRQPPFTWGLADHIVSTLANFEEEGARKDVTAVLWFEEDQRMRKMGEINIVWTEPGAEDEVIVNL